MSVNVNEDLMFATEDQMEAVFGVQAEDVVDTQKYLIFFSAFSKVSFLLFSLHLQKYIMYPHVVWLRQYC